MGRHKKPKPIPPTITGLIKSKIDWALLVETLGKAAIGGYTYKNYNGQEIVAQPNIDALRLLITFAWGKPAESKASALYDQEQMDKVTAFLTDFMLPKDKGKKGGPDIKPTPIEEIIR